MKIFDLLFEKTKIERFEDPIWNLFWTVSIPVYMAHSTDNSLDNLLESFQERLLKAPPFPQNKRTVTAIDFFDSMNFSRITRTKYVNDTPLK